MINIKTYTKADRLVSLCNEIDMPEEVTKQIRHIIENTDFTPLEQPFNGLFSIETGEASYKAIEEYCGGEQSGIKALSVYLTAALHTREMYLKKEISNSIYIDTMKIFTRFVNEHFTSYGRYGFDRGFWIYRNLAAVLFRLGQLEFEMRFLNEEAEGYGMPGDPVISVHIPSDAVLTRQELDNSYSRAKRFFERYFRGFHYKFAYCSTWLLSPVLKELLSPDSKILNFQADYKILACDEESTSYMVWVFKRKYDDLNELPETTTLARNIKNHVLKGGKIGSAFGIVKNTEFS